MYVPIGGIEQWIEIGGDAPGLPVLLYLHGGPGGSSRPAAAAWKGWERHFAVVHWDQRGAGRTFEKNGDTGSGPMSIERMVADGLEVAEFLCARLGRDKILLVAHSWGSIMGVHMIRRRPDLFSAYVGTGQVVDMRRTEEMKYTTLLERARDSGNRAALDELAAIGPPPHAGLETMRILLRWTEELARGDGDPVRPRPPVRPTNMTKEDADWLMRGFAFSTQRLYREIMVIDLPALGLDFAVPVFFFQGVEDLSAPIQPVADYCEAIRAPHKGLVRFENCHHFVVMNRPDDFLAELLARKHLLV